MLNNRAGRGFDLEAGHPNCITPGKRTMHTLSPYMAFKGGVPHLVWGTPGGDGQPQWCLQILLNIEESGMNIQQAVEAPRWQSFPGTDPSTRDEDFELRMESGFPEGTVQDLERRGHRVRPLVALEGGGGAQAILVDVERGVYGGASDPRVDGCAVGL
jgi:gamma-glutamyltranspeptidase/glutathione hydrolase